MLSDNQQRRNRNVTRELQAIGENLPQYISMATYQMSADDTNHPTKNADDLVSEVLITYAEKLKRNGMYMATDSNHAQARFTNFLKNRLRDLRKKRWSEGSDSDIEQKAWTVDATTFDQTIDLLNQAKAKLKPNDTVRLERILDGENIKDIMPKQTLQMFRRRVRKVYNAL